MALHGVIIYNILNNNCLTGTWTNSDHGNVLTESAKKFTDANKDSIIGTYVCSYIEEGGAVFKGILSIRSFKDKTYKLEWEINKIDNSGTFKFEGVGFEFAKNRLAVSYISA